MLDKSFRSRYKKPQPSLSEQRILELRKQICVLKEKKKLSDADRKKLAFMNKRLNRMEGQKRGREDKRVRFRIDG